MLGVTLFGIFLTPVFFYVIQGLSETKLFSAVPTRWLGSTVLGAAAGTLMGYLLERLGVVRPAWGLGIGAVAGGLVGLAIQTLQQRVRPRTAARTEHPSA
jgi:multidrug efflux pump